MSARNSLEAKAIRRLKKHRNSVRLTDPEFEIGICHVCSRYGQIGKPSLVCELPQAPLLAGKEFFKRTRYCQRVKEKRAN